jgi:hypothetical protein
MVSTSKKAKDPIYYNDWNDLAASVNGLASSNYAPPVGSTAYAPFTGSTAYIAGTTTDLWAGTSTSYYPYSTNEFSLLSHLHSTVYAPITGSTIYVSGLTSDYITESDTIALIIALGG